MKLFTINNKDLLDIDTTILCPLNFNYTTDIVELTNKGCETITKNGVYHSSIPDIILKEFNCEHLKNPQTKVDNIKINILSSILSPKSTIIFFNVLTYVDNTFKEKIITYLKKQHKRIINYTSEIEETLLLDYLIVIHNNKVIMEGDTKSILKEEKILRKLGYSLPVIVELSMGLTYYNLIDKIYYKNTSLVDDLWK